MLKTNLTAPDGNCGLTAFSQVEKVSNSENIALRNKFCDYEEVNKSNYQPLLILENNYHYSNECNLKTCSRLSLNRHKGLLLSCSGQSNKIVSYFEEYVAAKRCPGVWLNFTDMGALALSTNVHLVIVDNSR